ncbi:uncharacterized protein [Solanum lycopersicum]|uniref:uncharacterized protein n=1 Tax=Solanum lycopersicum TaxID=4081 RepID=UPI00374A9204
MRKHPKNKQGGGNLGNKAQSSSAAPPGRDVPRGATCGTGDGTNRLYALNNCQEPENSPDVVTDMFVIVFVDDILVYSRKKEDYASHVSIVLQTLKDKELHAKLYKCEFWLKSVVFLGHIVSGNGIIVNTQKIKVVQSCPRPTSPTDIRSFLGLAGYYRIFIEGFSFISSPMTKVTQKTDKFQLSEACEKNFQELKKRLTTSLGFFYLNRGLSIGSTYYVEEQKRELAKDVHRLARLEVRLMDSTEGGIVAIVHKQRVLSFEQWGDGELNYQGRLCVPKVDGLQERILEKAHSSRYSIHLGPTKMYSDFTEVYWWEGKKILLLLLPSARIVSK